MGRLILILLLLISPAASADETLEATNEISENIESYFPSADASSKESLNPVLEELSAKGWKLTDDGTSCYLERKYVLLITRDPERQKELEDSGEVEIGDNTYERIRSERIECPNVYRDANGKAIEIEPSFAIANAAARAFSYGDKPSNFIRDYEETPIIVDPVSEPA